MIPLGDLPGGLTRSIGEAISPNGTHVVGYSGSAPGGYEGYIWSEATGMVGVGRLPGAINSGLSAVSSMGRVAVGASGDATIGNRAVRWTAETGLVSLGTLPGGEWGNSTALGVSADGRMIVGSSSGPGRQQYATRWTEEAGYVALPSLPDSAATGQAWAVSDDGLWVVGESDSGGGASAAMWTPDNQVIELGRVRPGTPARAFSVSLGGRVVVGDSGGTPFLWTASGGMRYAMDALKDYGLNVAALGWNLRSLNDVSADGSWLVGQGISPEGKYEGFLIHIPAPGVVVLAGLLGGCTALRRRSRF
jgi:uncharacterized membrane protein